MSRAEKSGGEAGNGDRARAEGTEEPARRRRSRRKAETRVFAGTDERTFRSEGSAGAGRRMRRRRIERRKARREILGTLVYFFAMLFAVYLILHYVGQRSVVQGDSMETTLSDGQNLIVDKISYRFHDPERYDIIIFPGPEEYGEHPYYIKRVIGLPGETVQIKDGKVYINNEKLKTDVYGITDDIDEPGIAAEPLTLGDDEYFCLGDNRPVSYDSRYEEVGPVSRSEILGKVFIRIWPLDKFGWVD